MPEFRLDSKKIKKKYPVLEPVVSSIGTLTIMSGSIQYLIKVTGSMESEALANPTVSEFIFPTIEKIKETTAFTLEKYNELLISKKSELDEYKKIVQDYEIMINKPKIKEKEIQVFFEKFPFIIDRSIDRK